MALLNTVCLFAYSIVTAVIPILGVPPAIAAAIVSTTANDAASPSSTSAYTSTCTYECVRIARAEDQATMQIKESKIKTERGRRRVR